MGESLDRVCVCDGFVCGCLGVWVCVFILFVLACVFVCVCACAYLKADKVDPVWSIDWMKVWDHIAPISNGVLPPNLLLVEL